MSAINLYASKAEAFYVKDSQRNSFYEYGGIQLFPNIEYTQGISNIELANGFSVSIYKAYDDTLLDTLNYTLKEQTNASTIYADSLIIFADNETLYVDSNATGTELWSIIPTNDYGNDLVYLKFVGNPISNLIAHNFKTRVLADLGIIEGEAFLNAILLGLVDSNDYSYYYTNPFYITSLDEDRCTKIEYKNSLDEINQSIGLKFWFRQKSRQSELTTYYESSTKNTVTQAVKTHNLEMYESEFMSIDDLILTATILESSYLYIGTTRYSLFEAIKIPELTQQENFGKLKFTLAPNN